MPSSLRKMVRAMLQEYHISNDDIEYVANILIQRESICSTVFVEGIAFPHAKLEILTDVHAGWFLLQEPIDFRSPMPSSVNMQNLVMLVFILLAPPSMLHVPLIVPIASSFINKAFRTRVFRCRTNEELRNTIAPAIPNHLPY